MQHTTTTVHVDVCRPGMPCIAPGCQSPARLWVCFERRLHYCPEDAVRRIWLHQKRYRAIEVSDAAKAILIEVAV